MTASSSSSRSPSSGWPRVVPTAAWSSPACAASARPCCSTRCAASRSSGRGAPARSRPDPTSRCACRSPRRCTQQSARSPIGTGTPTGSTRWPAYSRRSRCAPSSRTASPAVAEQVAAADRRGRRQGTGRLRRPRARPGRAVHRRRSAGRRPRRRIALFVDEMQDIAGPMSSGQCAAPVTRSASRAPRSSWSAPGCRTCPVALVVVEVVRRTAVPLRLGRPASPRDGRAGLDRVRRRARR